MKTHILVINDDPLHCKLLSFLLTDAGYDVSVVSDRRAVDGYMSHNVIDLVLLDVTPSFGSHLDLCVRLRNKYPDIPIILMSDRAEIDDLVKGFSQGADDYVSRPYEPAELLARAQAVLRRYRRVERNLYGVLIKVGNTSLDLGRLSFTSSGRSVIVTPTEMRILECLMRNANAVISREKLIEQTWGYDSESADNRVDVYIRRLRRKIEAHPKDRNLIRTVRGIGYIFQDNPSDECFSA